MGKIKHGSKNSKFKQKGKNNDIPSRKSASGGKQKRFGKSPKQNKYKKEENRHEKSNTKGDSGTKKARNKNKQKWKAPESDSEFEEVGPSLVQEHLPAEDQFPIKESEAVDAESELKEARKLVQQQNRKKKKSGGFQSMGLSHHVYKGVIRKGYKIPTPIQRKTIPLIMDGKDVVAMARTGSGKTAAFLLPMFERLKTHLTTGARGLVLAPTRELALQTLKFTKELGRFTSLKSAVVLGGDSMEEQFAAIHENPDIIIATPGRFMHVLVEMELKLSSIEYIVFDEADRLFELGFQEQLREILQRVPENRQTVLFSATLPKLLVEFAKAGLHDPTLIRLDVDTKLSENLKMAFLQCQTDNKVAALLHLLRTVIKPSEQTVVFAATKHHVDYLQQVLSDSGLQCSYSYSSLDQTARKINVAKFRNKKTMILIVTDLAARGIDIPLLDNVINYNFPAKSKLFVHRVGRVARAGRSGMAYSLVSPDEMPYVLDLHMFLGRPLQYVEVGKSYTVDDALFGLIPQSIIDDEEEQLRVIMKQHDVQSQLKVTNNAYKQYVKSRPAPSGESIKRIKEMSHIKIGFHPLYGSISVDVEEDRAKLLQSMRNFKPKGTIFEVNTQKKSAGFQVMKTKREYHGNVIERNSVKRQEQDEERALNDLTSPSHQTEADEVDVSTTFSRIVAPKATQETKIIDSKKRKRGSTGRDEQYYLEYRPKDFQSERGLSLKTSFDKEADSAAMDIAGDDATLLRKQSNELKWDRKRKKYIKETGFESGKKRMKTESGHWISSTYKTNIYKDWLEKNKVDETEDASDEEGASNQHQKHGKGRKGKSGRGKHQTGFAKKRNGPDTQKRFKGNKNELKQKDQILKERRRKEKLRSFMKSKEQKRQKRKASKK